MSAIDVMTDPGWLPDGYDPRTTVFRFAKLSRDALHTEAFLDQRKNGAVQGWSSATLAELKPSSSLPETTAFIFHSAFCCSTLLARALDHPGTSLSLREPNVLMDVANAIRLARAGPVNAAATQAYATCLSLLARPHGTETSAIIKPTNAANNLAERSVSAGHPALFLYGDLKSFLVSILKKGEPGRAFTRMQFNIFSLDNPAIAELPAKQVIGMTDLQIATLVWRHQLETFAQLLAAAPANARVASLDADTLLSNPQGAVSAVATHFGGYISQAQIAERIDAGLFGQDAKTSTRQFNRSDRQAEAKRIADQHGEAIDAILKWATTLKLTTDIPDPLTGHLTKSLIA